MNPFVTFPDEVWRTIMDNLKDPKDQQNLEQCNLRLRELFKRRKTEWLFPLALPVLLKWSKMDRNIFFKSRAVSSKSCVAVDNYINELWDWELFDGKASPHGQVMLQFHLLSVRASFASRECIVTYFDKVLGGKRDFKKAPLIMKSLSGCFLENGERELDFRPKHMFPLIQRVGQVLRKVLLEVRFGIYQEVLEFIQWTFQNCSNLEIFDHTSLMEIDEEENLEELTPLPFQKDLKYLRFCAKTRNHSKLVNLFKASFSSLEILEMPLIVTTAINWNEIMFEKLRKLNLCKIPLWAVGHKEAALALFREIKAPKLTSVVFVTLARVEENEDLFTPMQALQTFLEEVESILKERYPGHLVQVSTRSFPGGQYLGLLNIFTLTKLSQ